MRYIGQPVMNQAFGYMTPGMLLWADGPEQIRLLKQATFIDGRAPWPPPVTVEAKPIPSPMDKRARVLAGK